MRAEHTMIFKNFSFSGFLHRHELSIDLRERRVLVKGWPQSGDVTAAHLAGAVAWFDLVQPNPLVKKHHMCLSSPIFF